MQVRSAGEGDIPAITRIYAHFVVNGLASFELEAPGEQEMLRRYRSVRELGLPYLVAELNGAVAGYAYASSYRPRPAYRFTVEDSIYIDRVHAGRGAGDTLLAALIVGCEACGCRQMIAVIGDSANHGSIALHAACGFARAGLLPAVGFKFGRWVDSVLMQRPLGPGDGTPPAT
jgi:phosphinothricin acetyltransferase